MIKKEYFKDYFSKAPLERFEENVLPLPEEVLKRAEMLQREIRKELKKKRCSKCKNSDVCVLYREIKSAIIEHSCILKNKAIIKEIENILASACTWYKEV